MIKLLTKFTNDPISAVAAATDAIMSFATSALPPTENRLARFKEFFPLRYYKMKKRIIRDAYKWCKHHKGMSIEAFIKFTAKDPEDEKELLELLKNINK